MTDQPDPGTPVPPPAAAASSAPGAPEPAAAAEPTPPPADGDAPVKLNRWLVGGVAAVVLLAVVVVAVLVLGGDDGGGGGDDEDDGDPVEVDAVLPAQVDALDASSPVVALVTDAQWDLDGGRFSTTFGNVCSYSGPGAPISCTLIGGDPNNRRDIPGADVTTGDGLGATSAGRALGDDDVDGCPGAAELREPDAPIAPGPALCILSSENRVFAVYLTGVDESGPIHVVAVEAGT